MMHRLALTLWLALFLHSASAPLAAQKQESSAQIKESSAQTKLCAATARKPPSAKARAIADTARDEFYYFGGHRIDSNGRLFSFGVVESEQEESDENITTYRLGHLGWWQVLRYWRLLAETKLPDEAARESLRLRGFANATREPTDKDITPPARMSLDRALDAIDAINAKLNLNAIEKEILREAVIRAGINDVAWSAAFISAVMRQAGLSDDEFEYSDAHASYIYAAFNTALAESGGPTASALPDDKATKQLYRACPTPSAKPRPGDLLCYHRHVKEHGNKPAAAIRAMILADIGSGEPTRSVRRSHCDVVVHTDTKAARVYVVGGNVQQAVTIKKLRLSPRTGTLLEAQPGNCRLDGRWTFPQPATGKPIAPHLATDCSLNAKGWFVLLQARL